jgi:hypothetical protein
LEEWVYSELKSLVQQLRDQALEQQAGCV